jgi:hypothetical protein
MVKGTADKTFVSPAPVVESQTPNVVKAAVFLATRGIIKARVRMHFILRGVCGWHYSHVLPTTKKKRLLSDIINHIPSQKNSAGDSWHSRRRMYSHYHHIVFCSLFAASNGSGADVPPPH